MLVVFANNLTLVANTSSTVVVYTDPIALGSNDRGTPVTNVHSMFNAGTPGLNWEMQTSNDGQTWLAQGPSSGNLTSEGATLQTPTLVTGVYGRLKITFTSSGAGIGATTFDIHVNFDHA